MNLVNSVKDAGRTAVDVAAYSDPVAAFWWAHRHGRPIAVHTSGTTGRPRTILRSTASWVDSFGPAAERLGITSSSRFHIPGALTATMNLFAACIAQYAGARWSCDPNGATHVALTPSGLSRELDSRRLASGTVVLVAGDGLRRRVRDRAVDHGLRVEHYYGATELSLVAWGSCRDDLRLFDEVEVRIEDGSIWVRSPWLSDGPAPDSPLGPWRRGEDGFVSIGDRGRLDGNLLVVSGRAGAITTGGVTVELAPLAERLREVAIGEIHVVGIPHPVVGQVLGCAVSRRDDIERLRSWSHSHLAPAERPREWSVIAHTPLTAAGKLDMAALAELIHGHGVPPQDAQETRR